MNRYVRSLAADRPHRSAMIALALLGVAAIAAQPGCARRRAVATGVDVLEATNFEALRQRRVGLITNPTGVTHDLRSTVDVLHESEHVQLVALFGPEHGVRGDAHAGDHVADALDPRTGVPEYSLYGKNRRPTAEMLEGIDTLVFDIQDIGSRSYTYISTMAAAMEAAAEHDVAFVVLDRPNPLGGERVEGRVLDMQYKSFVGYLPIPYVHGLTVGELARMINEEGWLPDGRRCRLTVVPMRGWKRAMTFADTGLTWVPTSPHLPRAISSHFYAATGIMGELKVVSEGVGYPLPFELAGATGLDANLVADRLDARRLPGVHFRPMVFKPYYGRNEGRDCHGVQVYLLDPQAAYLTSIQFHVLDVLRAEYTDLQVFGNDRDRMFDKVCGTSGIRERFISGAPLADILAHWNEGVSAFRAQREPYLRY